MAYTFVGPYDLGVSIKRHGAAPTLAAVVEQSALASTVSADGTAAMWRPSPSATSARSSSP